MYVRDGASAEEIEAQARQWNRLVRRGRCYLIPFRAFLASATFVLTLRQEGVHGAFKAAREMWKLPIS